MSEETPKMPKTIWALGFVSLLMDVSSETIHGLLPVFLISVLGANYTMVGLIEGVGEGTALAFKVLSGPISDRLGKRKPIVFFGYALGTISKPLFAIAQTPAFVLGARFFDRIGKGIRGAPRDAMIADIAPPSIRGRAFGLRQSLDTVGAFTGPLLAILLMGWTNGNYRAVFWFALVPGVMSVAMLFFGVQEPEVQQSGEQKKVSWGSVREFPRVFWIASIAGAILQLARFSEAFLILRVKGLGLSLNWSPVVLVVMNIIYSLAAYPIGWLSDRFRREWFLFAGFIVLICANFVLGFATNLTIAFAGISLWGLHMGLTQGTLSALVADSSPAYLRGTAFGLFNLLSAVALFLASGIAGVLWDQIGPKMTFLASATFSFIGMAILAAMYGRRLLSRRA